METSAVGGLARVCISPPSPTMSPLCQTPTPSPLTLHPCFVSLNLLAASGAPTPSLSYLCFYFHLDSASFIGKAPQKTCLCLSFLFPFFLEPAPVKFLCLSYIPEKLVSKAPVSLAWLGPMVLPYYSLTWPGHCMWLSWSFYSSWDTFLHLFPRSSLCWFSQISRYSLLVSCLFFLTWGAPVSGFQTSAPSVTTPST